MTKQEILNQRIDTLRAEHRLSFSEWEEVFRILIEDKGIDDTALLMHGKELSQQTFGTEIYVRGLVEFTNYCRNDCYYCGIRAGNSNCKRYRLTEEDVLSACRDGYALGFRTFVLQGGEDPFFGGFEEDDVENKITQMVRKIRDEFPDCAITLSVGERPYSIYEAWHKAGADRYLLRHETANDAYYQSLHPDNLKAEHRKQCLRNLKEIGYQIGAGFMVGAPGQMPEHLAEDMCFLQELNPHMIGIGPFVPHHDTPFANEKAGTVQLTLQCIALLRLTFPKALIPATTALGTMDPMGREKGVCAGANVVMPNLSPVEVRKKYELYDNKICTGEEAAECRFCLQNRMESIGYQVVVSRGDFPGKEREGCR